MDCEIYWNNLDMGARPEKPVYLQPDCVKIPAELKNRNQWVVWRAEFRDGQKKPWTKAPYRPDGNHASSTDPTTWCSFEDAVAAYNSGRCDGIGFVFTPDDPYVGIDFDGVNETDSLFAELQSLGSYTERSVSGSGYHTICRGEFPEGCANRRGKLEVYTQGRYFTMTGNVPDWAVSTVKTSQQALDALCEKHLSKDNRVERAAKTVLFTPGQVEPMTEADNALLTKMPDVYFKALLQGDISGFENDDSKADFALCCFLSPFTPDDTQIARIWRASKLMRPKLDRKDYVQRTIAAARAQAPYSQAADYGKWSKLRVKRASQCVITTPGWIWEGFIARGCVSMLHGDSKRGKSTLLCSLLRHMGVGGDLGGKVSRNNVLVISEESENVWSYRGCASWGDHISLSFMPSMPWEELVSCVCDGLSLLPEQGRPALVVFDTFAPFSGVEDENDAAKMMLVLTQLDRLKRLNVGVLIVHHNRKSGGTGSLQARGSSTLMGYVDFLLALDLHSTLTDSRRDLKTVSRFGSFTTTTFDRNPDTNMYFTCEKADPDKKWIECLPLAPSLTVEKIREAYSGSDNPALRTWQTILKRLADEKKISVQVQGKNKLYFRTSQVMSDGRIDLSTVK